MDPKEALKRILGHIKDVKESVNNACKKRSKGENFRINPRDELSAARTSAEELLEAINDLEEWVEKNGYVPRL